MFKLQVSCMSKKINANKNNVIKCFEPYPTPLICYQISSMFRCSFSFHATKFENKILISFRATWAILPWSIVALCWIRVLHIIKKLKVSVLSHFFTKFWRLYIMNVIFYTLNIMAFIYNV